MFLHSIVVMLEIDTVFSLKQSYALLYIYQNILKNLNLNDPVALSSKIFDEFKHLNKSKRNMLEQIINTEFVNSTDVHKVGRFSKYLDQELAFEMVVDKGILNDKILILTDSIGINEYGEKQGCDPYSNSFVFSNNLIKLGDVFPKEFLHKIVLMYMHPVMFNQTFDIHDNDTYIVDIIKKNNRLSKLELEKLLNSQKFIIDKGYNPRIGIANYSLDMFDVEAFEEFMNQDIDKWMDDNLEKGESLTHAIEKQKTRILFNKILMGLRYGYYFDKLHNSFVKTKDDYNLQGLPLMMNKTSFSYEILNIANRFRQYKFKDDPKKYYHFIGGKPGINAGKMLRRGIHEPSAFSRLTGFLKSINPDYVDVKKSDISPTIFTGHKSNLVSDLRIPWSLIEEDLMNGSPIMTDMILEKESDKTKQKRKDIIVKIVDSFARSKKVGFSRIERHIEDLMKYKGSIYLGRRNESKSNLWWPNEIKDKKIVFPYFVKDFFGDKIKFLDEQDDARNINSDFRGSEFSMSANCSIQKLISKFTRGIVYDILDNIILTDEDRFIFERLYHPILKEPTAAVRGTAIHEWVLNPFKDLKHYKTLENINIEPCPSDYYCETEFVTKYKNGLVSFHPDTFFLLDDGFDVYDIVILDVKTNRRTPYPKICYLMQTGFYAKVIADVMHKNGIKTGNFYVSLIHNAFDNDFDSGLGTNKKMYNIFRPQKLSPITKFTKEDSFIQFIDDEYTRTLEEKHLLLYDSNKIFEIKEESLSSGKCDHCYFEHEKICNYMCQNFISFQDIPSIGK